MITATTSEVIINAWLTAAPDYSYFCPVIRLLESSADSIRTN
jgi:hypothetical protein